MKDQPGQDLGDYEEEDDIDAEETAEVPGRGVDGEAVEEEDERTDREGQNARQACRQMERFAKDRVAAGFKQRGEKQNPQLNGFIHLLTMLTVRAGFFSPEKRNVVEAGGFEPPSEIARNTETTCVSGSESYLPPESQQDSGKPVRLISGLGYEQKPAPYPTE